MALLKEKIRGHLNIQKSLEESILKGRVPSTLLFRGPDGVGKQLVAQSFAQNLFCERQSLACGECPSCLRVSKRQHENLLMIQNEEVSLKLDDISPIFEFVRLQLLGRARMVVINDAHKLNIQAANRLLKTLEEPPPKTHFILITSQESLLPVTIRSRSQLVRFAPLEQQDLRALAEAPAWVYKACQGRMDLLTQMTSQDAGETKKLSSELFRNFCEDSRAITFPKLPEMIKEKESALEHLQYFNQFLRDIWILKSGAGEIIHNDLKKTYDSLSNLSFENLEELWNRLQVLKRAVDQNADRVLNFENLWFEWQEALGTGS